MIGRRLLWTTAVCIVAAWQAFQFCRVVREQSRTGRQASHEIGVWQSSSPAGPRGVVEDPEDAATTANTTTPSADVRASAKTAAIATRIIQQPKEARQSVVVVPATNVTLRRTPHPNTTAAAKGDDEERPFFFIHIPKTGTSFFTVLRNRMTAHCPIPGFSCMGGFGGGLPGAMTTDGINHFPYNRDMFNLTRERAKVVNTCHGKLPQCSKRRLFHCPYRTCRNKPRKVVLFRSPLSWFASQLDFMYVYWATQKPKKRKQVSIPFRSQIEFATATNNVTRAVYILQNNYAFWGITDDWDATVCVFHCELGGETHPSELVNSRGAKDYRMKTPAEALAAIRPNSKNRPKALPEEMVPNQTSYVLEHYTHDLELFHEHLVPLFAERAKKCNCDFRAPNRP